jgi:ketosteroid isomerase-like protein
MSRTAIDLTRRYFTAWRAKDMDAYRALLADEVHFSGPLGEAHGADECVAGMRRLAESTTDVVVH